MLVNCPECGRSVSDQAPACPHCGFPGPLTGPGAPPAKPEIDQLPPSLSQPIFGDVARPAGKQPVLKVITILSLIACSPVGVVLVWFVSSWSLRTRGVLTVLGILWFLGRL